MKDNKIIKIVTGVFVGLAAYRLAYSVGAGIYNGINKMNYKKKIEKGLKDGSIIEIDGQYFEMKVEEA